jgi:protein involved in polysaccharide export with SLBB domain
LRFARFWALILKIHQGAIIIASSEVLKPTNSGIVFYGKTTAWRVAPVLAALFLACIATLGQNQSARQSPTQNSELGRENLSRVSASAGEIKAVIIRDIGLMVELKRWVAKDATDHGQIITDADLTNDAIFDRLDSDAQFRAVATQLVQRYGYLVPQMNPESEQAREQALLIAERTKWIAQHEEEARAQSHERNRPDFQTSRGCDPQQSGECIQQPARGNNYYDNYGNPREQQQEAQPGAPGANPNQPNQQITPRRGENLEYTQFMQSGDQYANDFPQFPSDGSYDYNESLASPGSGSGISPSMAQSLMKTGSGNGEDSETFTGKTPQGQQGNLLNLGMGGAGMYGASGTGASLEDLATNLPDRTNGPEMGMQPNYLDFRSRNRFYELQREQAMLQPVEMVRRPDPYVDIPSLYDMYMQAVPRPVTPQRFGIGVFENGIRDSRMIPMDLPAGPDYVVGPGDGLTIDIWGGVSRRLIRTVDREGRVNLPEVGPVLVSGKNLAQVQDSVQQLLRSQLRNVSADVSLARLRTIRVYEVGDLVHPGAYDISSLSTPLNALFVADGPTSRGSLRILKHYRDNQLVQTVDVYDLLLHGVKGDMMRLENGDTILVPPIGPQVTVEGMVRRPAIYELKDENENNLASVLELAGGLLPTAAVRHIEVQRVVAHDKQTMLSLDIRDAGDNADVTKKMEEFQVHDGDRIRIFPIAPYNQDAIYLEGHVIRPGRYSYRADMRLTDVVASYKDLLPEPASQYAEIIRLNPPDFHPSVESFSLSDALADPSKSPELKAMDTIRIFGRFDFENPPTVSVWGDVRMPGTYRTSGSIRLADAVHLAGGLAPDAQTESAQVFRYLPGGESKIFSVNLGDALGGDAAANIPLEARDRVLVHRDASNAEPATVYIKGDVTKPGRYPWTNNMTVADLILVGGGLKASADAQTADLTHYQWASQQDENAVRLTGEHQTLSISAALKGDPNANLPLHNGDVLTIRELPGWNELGASITVRGEVQHPGTYGIKPGERLSSILARAGGYQSDAYPYGAVLQRVQVRDEQMKQQTDIILRVKGMQSDLQAMPESTADEKQSKQLAMAQYQQTLQELASNPPAGRVAMQIAGPINRWKNTSSDIPVRNGDTLTIPKKPAYIMVTGQVYNPTAVTYRPGQSAKWYLSQSGGPTPIADKKSIFVIRADGSVIGARQSLWSGPSLSAALRPGDTVVVPEKAYAGPVNWTNLFTAAQVAASITTAIFIAVHY